MINATVNAAQNKKNYICKQEKNCYNGITNLEKAGDYMPGNGEIIERAINDFQKVQKRMTIAREEHAARTYAELKEDYISLKALLTCLGVNLSEIDRIKE